MSERTPSATGIGSTARGGARAAAIAQLAVQLGSALATVILARILAPAEFGIIALAQSLMGVASLVSLAGITAAIVTHKGDVRTKAATYFWVAALVGIAFAGLLVMLSAPLVSVLGQPGTGVYVSVLAVTLPLGLMTLVPQALLQRRLQFGRMSALAVIGAFVYFVVEVVLALLGWGAWAVIWGQVAGAIATLILAMILAKWLPTSRPRIREITEDVGLLANMGLGAFLGYLGKNVDYWVVSRSIGQGPLGVYYIAYVLPSIIRLRMSAIFRQVMLPLVARIEDRRARAEVWAKAFLGTLSLALPVMFGIAAVSHPLVALLFGQQWGGAAAPMRLITLAGIADIAITAVSTMAIASRSHVTRSTAVLGLRAGLILAGAAIAAWQWTTVTSVAAAVLVGSLATLVVQEFYVARKLGVGLRVLGSQPLRILVACCTMFVIVDFALSTHLAALRPGYQLTVAVPLGVATYALVALVVARQALVDSLSQLRRLIGGR